MDTQSNRDWIAKAVSDAVDNGVTWDEARVLELEWESRRGEKGCSLPRRASRALRVEIAIDAELERDGWTPEQRAEAREHRRLVRLVAPDDRVALKAKLDSLASRRQRWSNL